MPGNPTLSLTPKTPPVLLMIVNDSIRPKRGKVKSEGEKQQKERGHKPTEPEANGGASAVADDFPSDSNSRDTTLKVEKDAKSLY